MPGGADRAINMALRVIGIGEVERDFRRVGQAGEKSFEQVEKSANGADRAVSEYTTRLKRAVDVAKRAFDATPGVAEGRAQDPRGYLEARNKAILGAVEQEKNRIAAGLPDLTGEFDKLRNATDTSGASLTTWTARGAALGAGLVLLKKLVFDSAQAFIEHEKSIDRFEAQLRLTGNLTLATGKDVETMARRIAAATLQTEDAVLQAANSLATVPGLTKEGLDAALEASARLADALGTDVADVVNDIVRPAFEALSQHDLKAFYETTEGKVSPSLQKLVIDLADAGRTADAQRALIDGLRTAAGDGPNGLTRATDKLSDSWERMKVSIGEDVSGPASSMFSRLADWLDIVTARAERARGGWLSFLSSLSNPANLATFVAGGYDKAGGAAADQDTGFAAQFLQQARDARAQRELQKRFPDKDPKSSKNNEADKLKTAAEQARAAADRVAEANAKVVESYRLRAQEAQAKIGLEGDALAAVERHQEIEATLRRLNRDEIDKEVAARKAEAAAAGKTFDEAKAVREATKAVEAKSVVLREYAETLADANRDIAEFNARQAQAKAILEQVRTPIEALNLEIEKAIESLSHGDITADQFNRRMDQLAEGFAKASYEADRGAQAWRGFGTDVGRTLTNIALNGGSAIDILKELIRLPLERLLQQTVENPVAAFIDSATGNNRDKNLAAARANLPNAADILDNTVTLAADGAATSLTSVDASAPAAAASLADISASLGNPVADLTGETQRATQAMAGVEPAALRAADALSRILTGGSGGGGGLLSAALGLAGAAIGGGGITAATAAKLAPSAAAAIADNPALFASGTDRVPPGRPFWVGENGRELMQHDGSGRLSVLSNQQAHRAAGGGGLTFNNYQTIMVPERADPRRTGSDLARSTQGALARAANKGLATGPRFAR